MTTGLRFFYRHIYVTGLENIPAKGPVIIIANHNSSLMDAALMGILLKRKAWFFARGDVFANKIVKKILWWLHMLPVHSYNGGRSSLNANDNSFSEGQKILLNGGIVVFFPESTSHVEHQLLPFRKGVFRLGFDAINAADFSFDIPIVPIGITYDHPVACRTNVQVHAGKPLLLSTYKNEYLQNAAAALLHICKDAQQAVNNLVLHINEKNRLVTAEHFLTICRNNNAVSTSTWKIASAEKLNQEKEICNSINNTANPDFENRQTEANSYFNALSLAKLNDKTVCTTNGFAAWKKVLLWVGFPVYVLGLLLNGLPVLLARRIADKKVYRQDFYSWIFAVCYSFSYFFWLIGLLIIASFWGWQYVIGLLLIMITTGLFAYKYKDWLKENNQQRYYKTAGAARINKLKAMRSLVQIPAVNILATSR